MEIISWNYNGKRYCIDWFFVSLVLFVIGVLSLIEQKGASLSGFILFAAAVIAAILEYLSRRSEKKAIDPGKVVYNLAIEIKCDKTSFSGSRFHDVADEIELYGLAIHRAKKYLKGNWQVTKKGFLIRGTDPEAENHHVAEMDIVDAWPGLLALEAVLTGREKTKENLCKVHLHFRGSGAIMIVNVDANKRLYLT